METENDAPVQKNKIRHRKKHIYNSILQQMEFYFSDSNLTKDRFMANLIQEDPCVSLDIFLKFNKIRKLTTNIEDIRKAIKHSEIIEMSEDKTKIKRKLPVKEKTNVEECTVYVEQLKADVTHDWLTSVFSEFGKVVYVSLPRYKHNNSIKGFGFVEFDTEQEAQCALSFFESIECKIPSNLEPEHLCSVTTFEGSNEKDTDTSEKSVPALNLKRKHEAEEAAEDSESERKKTKTDTEEDPKETPNKEERGKKKKQRKENKRKIYMKELGIRVLSKKEWKKMRNKYLDMQRQKMKEFKKHLHKAKYSNGNYEEKEVEPKKVAEKKQESGLEFSGGLIVKIILADNCGDLKKLKNEIKSTNDVKYVDIPNPGTKQIYVRFGTKEGASSFSSKENFGTKEILKDEEEKQYWDKLLEYKDMKQNKDVKKKRGRDKLLQKANKLIGHHIKFDE